METTNRDLTIDFHGQTLHVPAGTECVRVQDAYGPGTFGFAVKDPLALGAWEHDAKHWYAYVPADAVNYLHATLVRSPLCKKSDTWNETAFQWSVELGGQRFDYYTGSGCVDKNGKPTNPSYDDVLSGLLLDSQACEMSFAAWCVDFGYDTDSRKALATYESCQITADKLRKTGIDIAAERERLADY